MCDFVTPLPGFELMLMQESSNAGDAEGDG